MTLRFMASKVARTIESFSSRLIKELPIRSSSPNSEICPTETANACFPAIYSITLEQNIEKVIIIEQGIFKKYTKVPF